MKRTKRFTLRVAVGLAVAAAFAPVAQAEPMGSYERQQSSVEIPYLSGGVGVSHMDFDPASPASGKMSDEIAYLSGGSVTLAPDDLVASRPSNSGSPAVASSGGRFDVDSTAISGFGIALVLLAGGSAIAIRHSRRTKLSPA